MSDNNDTYSRLYNGAYFGNLALDYLSKMEEALIESDKVSEANKQRKIDHDEATYQRLEPEKVIKDSAVSTILFSGMAAEAYIYDYSARNLGNNLTDDHIDNMKAESKWLIVTQLITGKEFPKDKIAFCLLKELIKTRNSMVHSKSRHVDLDTITVDTISKTRDTLINNARSSIRALHELGKQIELLDSDEHAIFLLGVSSFKPT